MKKLEKEFMKNFINPLFADYLNEKRAMEKTKVLNKKRKKMIDQSNDRFNGIFRKDNVIYCPFWKNSRVLLEYLKRIPASSGDLTIKFY